jgi:hypothetical protein
MLFMVLPYIRCKTPLQDQRVFRLLDWIMRYTLFHGSDTLGSHLREEGSLYCDGGLVRLQVQMKHDMHIHREQSPLLAVGSGRRAAVIFLFWLLTLMRE